MSDSHNDHFIVPVKYYVRTLLTLLFLTVLTVLVSLVDFGSFNTFIAILIAVVKATLVLSIFMGLFWDEAFNRVILFGSVTFFLLFIVVLILDVGTRNDLYPNERDNYKIDSPVRIVKEYSSHHASDSDHNSDSYLVDKKSH